MLGPRPEDFEEGIDPATGLPFQPSSAVTDAPPEPAAPIIDDEPAAPATAAGASKVDDTALDAALGSGVTPDDENAPEPRKPLPDLTPTAAAPPPDMAPPAGARQKFTRTLQSPEDKAIAADQSKLDDAAVTAEQNASEVRQQKIREEQEFRAKQTADSLDHQKVLEDTLREHDARVQAALAKQQEYFEAAKAAPFHDLYAERSTGDRIIGSLAVFLGGLGGGENQALKILDQRMQHAYDKQAADIEGKWKVYAASSKNVDAAEKGKDEALGNLKLLQAARYESAADQLEQMKIRQGIPAEQAASDKNVLAIREKSLEIRRQEAKGAEDKVEWDTYGKARGKGGGGAGAGDAMGKFIEAAGKLDAGDPIPPEFGSLAAAAHIKPNQIATEVDKYRGSAAKSLKIAGAAAGAGDKDVNKRMDAYEKQAIGNAKSLGPVRVLSQIEAMRQGLEEAAASGDSDRIKAAVTKAKEQAGTLMSGGKLTNAQIQILHGLESTSDELTAKIGKFTGNPTEGKGLVKRLTNIIDDAGNDTVQQIGDIRQRGINEHLAPGGLADTEEKKRTFNNRNAGLYSQVKWHGKSLFDEGKNAGGAETSRAPSVAIPADPTERAAKAQRATAALADPSKTPEQKKKAKDYLIQIGAR